MRHCCHRSNTISCRRCSWQKQCSDRRQAHQSGSKLQSNCNVACLQPDSLSEGLQRSPINPNH